MAIDGKTKAAVDLYLTDRDAGFRAEQTLLIREEIESRLQKARIERRSQLQFIAALAGVSLLAIVGLAVEHIQSTAERVARGAIDDEVKTELKAVKEERGRLEQSAGTYIQINQKLENLQDELDKQQIEMKYFLAEVEKTLGRLKAAEGGAGVLEQLTRIIQELEEIKARNTALPLAQAGSGEPLLNLFPNEPEQGSISEEGTTNP